MLAIYAVFFQICSCRKGGCRAVILADCLRKQKPHTNSQGERRPSPTTRPQPFQRHTENRPTTKRKISDDPDQNDQCHERVRTPVLGAPRWMIGATRARGSVWVVGCDKITRDRQGQQCEDIVGPRFWATRSEPIKSCSYYY